MVMFPIIRILNRYANEIIQIVVFYLGKLLTQLFMFFKKLKHCQPLAFSVNEHPNKELLRRITYLPVLKVILVYPNIFGFLIQGQEHLLQNPIISISCAPCLTPGATRFTNAIGI